MDGALVGVGSHNAYMVGCAKCNYFKLVLPDHASSWLKPQIWFCFYRFFFFLGKQKDFTQYKKKENNHQAVKNTIRFYLPMLMNVFNIHQKDE